MSKYKVSDIAKDFGISSKDISAILAPLGGGAKKSSNALEEKELDFIFNKLNTNLKLQLISLSFANTSPSCILFINSICSSTLITTSPEILSPSFTLSIVISSSNFSKTLCGNFKKS